MTYACKDREPAPETVTVQDGWHEIDVIHPGGPLRQRLPLFRQIRNAFAGQQPCGHDFRHADMRCDGCSHR